LLDSLLQEMILRFDKPSRIFRRLGRLLLLSQLLSPLVAFVALLVATALGINTDLHEIGSTTQAEVNKLELIESEPSGRTKVEDSCCSLSASRSRVCPDDRHRSRKTHCGRLDTSDKPCSSLSLDCLACTCDYSCQYGKQSSANCTVLPDIACTGERVFAREYTCSYCYLAPNSSCSNARATSCRSTDPYTKRSHWYVATCSSQKDLLCLGSNRFSKKLECNWTEGYSYKTALALSITLGGFGADRFYLGYWQEGIGKLFSFGGLGVWTLVDVILVAVRYIGPADGSLFI